MPQVGVPNTPDEPSEAGVLGEVVVTFREDGRANVSWPRISGRSHRDVITDAVAELQSLLHGDVLEKVDGEPPREPPY